MAGSSEPIQAALAAALGTGAFAPPETVAHWRARYQPWLSGTNGLAAGMRPDGPESLAEILAVARTIGCSVWCFPDRSGFGALAGPLSRPVIGIDLSAMNRIVDIDTLSGYALVEPGVTYRQLATALREHEPRFWCDGERDGERSVAAGISGRGIGYSAYGDRTLMQCGMELMLADGTVVRTGMGALPKSNMWQLFKYGYGPHLDGSFQQSALGIPTKVGTWIMPAPPAYKPFTLRLRDNPALERTVDALRPLKITPVIQSTVAIAHGAFDAALNAGPDVRHPREQASAPAAADWRVYGALYGSRADVEVTWQFVSATLGALAGATPPAVIESADDALLITRAQLMGPGLDYSDEPAAASAPVFELGAVAPPEGAAAVKMYRIIAPILAAHGFEPSCEFRLSWRTMLVHLSLPFAPLEPASTATARACCETLIDALSGAGFGIVNASTDLLPTALRHYGGGLARVRERLKAGLDPNGILAD